MPRVVSEATPRHAVSEPASTVRVVVELARYSDAFTVDRGRDGCWRYVYVGGTPSRCGGAVVWAGWYRLRDGRYWRVWSCRGHLDGGERWVRRPDGEAGGAP